MILLLFKHTHTHIYIYIYIYIYIQSLVLWFGYPDNILNFYLLNSPPHFSHHLLLLYYLSQWKGIRWILWTIYRNMTQLESSPWPLLSRIQGSAPNTTQKKDKRHWDTQSEHPGIIPTKTSNERTENRPRNLLIRSQTLPLTHGTGPHFSHGIIHKNFSHFLPFLFQVSKYIFSIEVVAYQLLKIYVLLVKMMCIPCWWSFVP